VYFISCLAACQHFCRVTGLTCDTITQRVPYRYAYVIYKTEEAAKSIVQEYTEDPPVFGKNVLDVKFYQEPVATYPTGTQLQSSLSFSI